MTTRFVLLSIALGLFAACGKAPAPSTPPAIEPPQISSATLDPSFVNRIAEARVAVVADRNSADAWGKLGQAFDAAEFPAEAQHCYQRASELDPQSARWLHLLALQQLQDAPDKALANLSRAAELAGLAMDASRLRLAQALIERGRWSDATTPLESLLQNNPNHAAARLELARIKVAQNEFDAAATLVQPALTNSFTARAAHLLASQIEQRRGNAAAAQALHQRGASMPRPFDWPDPFLREVQALRGDQQSLADAANALIQQRRFDDADRMLGELLGKSPNDAEGLLLLGRLRIQQRRCNEAQDALNRHLQVKTNSLHGFVQLGVALYCDSRWNDAAAAFRRAIELKPDFAQAHYNLGLALGRAGDTAGAIEAYRNALRSQPGDAASHAALAEELLRNGDRPSAAREADNALALDPRQQKAVRVRQLLGQN